MPTDSAKSKTLKLRGFKAQMVLDGQKTSSIRLFDDKDLSAGDELELIDSDSGESVARATITEVIIKKVGDIKETDLEGHERYASLDAMLENFRGFYGDRVTRDTPAKIIRFKLHD